MKKFYRINCLDKQGKVDSENSFVFEDAAKLLAVCEESLKSNRHFMVVPIDVPETEEEVKFMFMPKKNE